MDLRLRHSEKYSAKGGYDFHRGADLTHLYDTQNSEKTQLEIYFPQIPAPTYYKYFKGEITQLQRKRSAKRLLVSLSARDFVS